MLALCQPLRYCFALFVSIKRGQFSKGNVCGCLKIHVEFSLLGLQFESKTPLGVASNSFQNLLKNYSICQITTCCEGNGVEFIAASVYRGQNLKILFACKSKQEKNTNNNTNQPNYGSKSKKNSLSVTRVSRHLCACNCQSVPQGLLLSK